MRAVYILEIENVRATLGVGSNMKECVRGTDEERVANLRRLVNETGRRTPIRGERIWEGGSVPGRCRAADHVRVVFSSALWDFGLLMCQVSGGVRGCA